MGKEDRERQWKGTEVMAEVSWVGEEEAHLDSTSESSVVGQLQSGLIDQWLRGCLTTVQGKSWGWRGG